MPIESSCHAAYPVKTLNARVEGPWVQSQTVTLPYTIAPFLTSNAHQRVRGRP